MNIQAKDVPTLSLTKIFEKSSIQLELFNLNHRMNEIDKLCNLVCSRNQRRIF